METVRLRSQLACCKCVLSVTISGWQFKYNRNINSSFQPGVQVFICHTIPSRRRVVCPKFILHENNYLELQEKKTKTNKEPCNRWSGPDRTLISTSLSWSGITWRNKRQYGSLNPQKNCSTFSNMLGTTYLPTTWKAVQGQLILFLRWRNFIQYTLHTDGG